MPSLRKLSLAEIATAEQRPLSARAQIAQEYDTYVADFTAGDYGRVELAKDEQRKVVRGRLQAAARRRGLVLRFRPGLPIVILGGDHGDVSLELAAGPVIADLVGRRGHLGRARPVPLPQGRADPLYD